jgi:hypothetical protein
VAIGVMLGFLSHLVLDELCSVDFMGARIKLNKFAGSAVKLWSKSAPATIFTYLILVVLAWAVWEDNAQRRGNSTILTRPSTMLPVEAREPALVFLPAQLGPDMTRPGGRNRSTSAHRRTNTFL